ncbi:hypothetical protein C0J52_25862 [Blattella germanica]|nr:hypothetical protein C0J52_25862 [Blattella germanica]
MALLYETPWDTDMNLVARIQVTCYAIQNTPGNFDRVRQNLVYRCQACIETCGRQSTQLLYETTW